MKRAVLLAAACLAGTTIVSAQSPVFSTAKSSEGVKWGIRAGLNMAGMKLSYESVSYNFDSRIGFHAGVIADIPVVESFYIQPGLYLQQKGFKYDGSFMDDDMYDTSAKIEAKPLYLEIPVLASFRFNVGRSTQILANAGPYFAYGLGGKGTLSAGRESADEKFFSEGTNRFDCGISMGAGIQFSTHYYLGFAYELGLTNVAGSEEMGGASLKNKNWMISLGYNF